MQNQLIITKEEEIRKKRAVFLKAMEADAILAGEFRCPETKELLTIDYCKTFSQDRGCESLEKCIKRRR